MLALFNRTVGPSHITLILAPNFEGEWTGYPSQQEAYPEVFNAIQAEEKRAREQDINTKIFVQKVQQGESLSTFIEFPEFAQALRSCTSLHIKSHGVRVFSESGGETRSAFMISAYHAPPNTSIAPSELIGFLKKHCKHLAHLSFSACHAGSEVGVDGYPQGTKMENFHQKLLEQMSGNTKIPFKISSVTSAKDSVVSFSLAYHGELQFAGERRVVDIISSIAHDIESAKENVSNLMRALEALNTSGDADEKKRLQSRIREQAKFLETNLKLRGFESFIGPYWADVFDEARDQFCTLIVQMLAGETEDLCEEFEGLLETIERCMLETKQVAYCSSHNMLVTYQLETGETVELDFDWVNLKPPRGGTHSFGASFLENLYQEIFRLQPAISQNEVRRVLGACRYVQELPEALKQLKSLSSRFRQELTLQCQHHIELARYVDARMNLLPQCSTNNSATEYKEMVLEKLGQYVPVEELEGHKQTIGEFRRVDQLVLFLCELSPPKELYTQFKREIVAPGMELQSYMHQLSTEEHAYMSSLQP